MPLLPAILAAKEIVINVMRVIAGMEKIVLPVKIYAILLLNIKINTKLYFFRVSFARGSTSL